VISNRCEALSPLGPGLVPLPKVVLPSFVTRTLDGRVKTTDITVWGHTVSVECLEIANPTDSSRFAVVCVMRRPSSANDEAFLHDAMLARTKLAQRNSGKDVLIFLAVDSAILAELERRAGMAMVLQSIIGLRFGLLIMHRDGLATVEHGHSPSYHIDVTAKTDFGYWDRIDSLTDQLSKLIVEKSKPKE
jgi:hypothetical protein